MNWRVIEYLVLFAAIDWELVAFFAPATNPSRKDLVGNAILIGLALGLIVIRHHLERRRKH